MCCEVGHTCNCNQMITCHTCKQKIMSTDTAHIDSHYEDYDSVICKDCHVSIPRVANWNGLCRSCQIDRRISEGGEE
jgi:hypothetical protein